MSIPALRQLLADLGNIAERTEYEEALLQEIGGIVAISDLASRSDVNSLRNESVDVVTGVAVSRGPNLGTAVATVVEMLVSTQVDPDHFVRANAVTAFSCSANYCPNKGR